MAADVRWLGHSAFHLSGGGADVLIDPWLTGNPKARRDRRRAARGRDRAHPRPRRPPRRHGRHRQAHRREGAGDRRAGGRDRGRRRRRTSSASTTAAPSPSTGAGSRWSPPGTPRSRPKGTRAHARRAADPLRRPPDLPPRRHGAVQRPEADRAAAATASSSRWCRSAATTRWTASTPSPRSSSSTRSRRSRSTTARSRRSRPTRRRSSPTSSTPASREVLVLDPGDTHTLR